MNYKPEERRMPLTRGKKAEQAPGVMAAGSDNENGDFEEGFTSDQERETSRNDPIEFRKWKLELEMKAKAEERQMEKEKLALEMEREKIALEKERMAFELRRLELEVQANNNNNNNGRDDSEGRQLSKADLKRFPVFRKGDDPESFLVMFERACEDLCVRESERMIVLRSQISGGRAEIYAEMPIELIKNYEEYKKLVFARYGVNSEHLRQKFRALTKKPDESYSQFGASLIRFLDKWIQQEKVETVQDL